MDISMYSRKASHKNELTFDFIRKLNMKCCSMWVWYGIELEYLQLLCYIIIDAFVSLFGMIQKFGHFSELNIVNFCDKQVPKQQWSYCNKKKIYPHNYLRDCIFMKFWS